MPTMTREELYEFLWRPLRLSFTTIRPDGSHKSHQSGMSTMMASSTAGSMKGL